MTSTPGNKTVGRGVQVIATTTPQAVLLPLDNSGVRAKWYLIQSQGPVYVRFQMGVASPGATSGDLLINQAGEEQLASGPYTAIAVVAQVAGNTPVNITPLETN